MCVRTSVGAIRSPWTLADCMQSTARRRHQIVEFMEDRGIEVSAQLLQPVTAVDVFVRMCLNLLNLYRSSVRIRCICWDAVMLTSVKMRSITATSHNETYADLLPNLSHLIRGDLCPWHLLQQTLCTLA